MTLATRCASCETVFKVVQDQLKVSEGWVRCGRCDAVFNALEGLFDLGHDVATETVPPRVAQARSKETGALASAGPPSAGRSDDVDVEIDSGSGEFDDAPLSIQPGDDDVAALWSRGAQTRPGELLSDPIDEHIFRPRARADEVGERDRLEFSDARFDSDLFADNAVEADAPPTVVSPVTDSGALALESQIRPEFVRKAERRAVWQSPAARWALAGVAVAATLALAAQVAHHARDSIASQWPASRPLLAAWCGVARCVLQAPRRIDDFVVENSALTRASGNDSAFLLVVNLRNRSAVALQMPAIDLNLTDGSGRQIARRALLPRDFRVADVVAGGGEAALQLLLDAGGAKIAGYTVEIFYP